MYVRKYVRGFGVALRVPGWLMKRLGPSAQKSSAIGPH